jgi:predicted transcriptional regulator
MIEKVGKGMNKPAYARKTVERIKVLEAGQFNAMSVELAKLCVEAKLSPAAVAKVLGVTRGAVYRWMKGSKIREERRPRVQEFVEVIKKSLDSGELPKPNRFENDKFVESLCAPAQ